MCVHVFLYVGASVLMCVFLHVGLLIILKMKFCFNIPIVRLTVAHSNTKQIKAKKTVPYLILLNFQ